MKEKHFTNISEIVIKTTEKLAGITKDKFEKCFE